MIKISEEMEQIIEKIVDYAYDCDDGHMVSLLEALIGAIKAEMDARLAAITAERDAYAYALDGHHISLLEILFGATKSELEAKLGAVTAERDALKAELDAAKNQKPAGYMAKDTAVTCVYTAKRSYGDFSSFTPVYANPVPAQQLAELEALRNQEPVGEWRVHSKNRAGEEFGRLISDQRFEDGQKFYASPVPQQLEVIESAIFQVDVYVINGEYCITGSQIKKILQEQEFVRLKKEANNKKTEDL